MSEELENLKQTEKEKLANWETEFATELDLTQIKAEEESTPKDQDEEWPNWLAFMLIAFGLLALFGGFNIGGFSGWWFLIFLVPWIWGKGGCNHNCWW